MNIYLSGNVCIASSFSSCNVNSTWTLQALRQRSFAFCMSNKCSPSSRVALFVNDDQWGLDRCERSLHALGLRKWCANSEDGRCLPVNFLFVLVSSGELTLPENLIPSCAYGTPRAVGKNKNNKYLPISIIAINRIKSLEYRSNVWNV